MESAANPLRKTIEPIEKAPSGISAVRDPFVWRMLYNKSPERERENQVCG
jgi:hypothetical protein